MSLASFVAVEPFLLWPSQITAPSTSPNFATSSQIICKLPNSLEICEAFSSISNQSHAHNSALWLIGNAPVTHPFLFGLSERESRLRLKTASSRMGCASSKEEVEAVSAGPVAGRKKQFIESGTPNHGAPKQSESPKYVKVC
jgi:hypothetical protein